MTIPDSLLRKFRPKTFNDPYDAEHPVGLRQNTLSVELESKTGFIHLTERQAIDVSRYILKNVRKRIPKGDNKWKLK